METTSGPVIGHPHPNCPQVRRFVGIPYAAPPVGELFLRHPQPVRPWTAPRDCQGPAPTPQRRHYSANSLWKDPIIPGEEILNLTVTAPLSGTDLPVLVWIHGGGFKAGAANSPITDPYRFASEGVVCVSVSYRLGVEGFAHLPGTDPNRGLVDQQAALRWVQENIAAFGGDPGRVTIAGQSAGGGSVLAHLVAPASNELFQSAISMSGVLPACSEQEAARRAQVFAAQAQARGTWPLSHMSDAAVEAELATEASLYVPTTDPVEYVRQRARREPLSDLPFTPFQEPTVMPLSVEDGVAAGKGDDVRLLLTATTEEFTDLCLAHGPLLDPHPAPELFARAGVAWRPRYQRAFQAGAPTSLVVGMFLDDVFFPDFMAQLKQWRAQRGVDTQTHFFDWCPARSSTVPVPPAQAYARHCMDMPFVFDTVADPQAQLLVGDNPPRQLVEDNHRRWLEFITGA